MGIMIGSFYSDDLDGPPNDTVMTHLVTQSNLAA